MNYNNWGRPPVREQPAQRIMPNYLLEQLQQQQAAMATTVTLADGRVMRSTLNPDARPFYPQNQFMHHFANGQQHDHLYVRNNPMDFTWRPQRQLNCFARPPPLFDAAMVDMLRTHAGGMAHSEPDMPGSLQTPPEASRNLHQMSLPLISAASGPENEASVISEALDQQTGATAGFRNEADDDNVQLETIFISSNFPSSDNFALTQRNKASKSKEEAAGNLDETLVEEAVGAQLTQKENANPMTFENNTAEEQNMTAEIKIFLKSEEKAMKIDKNENTADRKIDEKCDKVLEDAADIKKHGLEAGTTTIIHHNSEENTCKEQEEKQKQEIKEASNTEKNLLQKVTGSTSTVDEEEALSLKIGNNTNNEINGATIASNENNNVAMEDADNLTEQKIMENQTAKVTLDSPNLSGTQRFCSRIEQTSSEEFERHLNKLRGNEKEMKDAAESQTSELSISLEFTDMIESTTSVAPSNESSENNEEQLVVSKQKNVQGHTEKNINEIEESSIKTEDIAGLEHVVCHSWLEEERRRLADLRSKRLHAENGEAMDIKKNLDESNESIPKEIARQQALTKDALEPHLASLPTKTQPRAALPNPTAILPGKANTSENKLPNSNRNFNEHKARYLAAAGEVDPATKLRLLAATRLQTSAQNRRTNVGQATRGPTQLPGVKVIEPIHNPVAPDSKALPQRAATTKSIAKSPAAKSSPTSIVNRTMQAAGLPTEKRSAEKVAMATTSRHGIYATRSNTKVVNANAATATGQRVAEMPTASVSTSPTTNTATATTSGLVANTTFKKVGARDLLEPKTTFTNIRTTLVERQKMYSERNKNPTPTQNGNPADVKQTLPLKTKTNAALPLASKKPAIPTATPTVSMRAGYAGNLHSAARGIRMDRNLHQGTCTAAEAASRIREGNMAILTRGRVTAGADRTPAQSRLITRIPVIASPDGDIQTLPAESQAATEELESEQMTHAQPKHAK